jgi:hypothetical protein
LVGGHHGFVLFSRERKIGALAKILSEAFVADEGEGGAKGQGDRDGGGLEAV